MSKLFARGNVRYHSARNNWALRREDDAYIDATCFDLQQAMEFMLKFIIEVNGEQYIANHDLRAQLNKIDRLGISNEIFEICGQLITYCETLCNKDGRKVEEPD